MWKYFAAAAGGGVLVGLVMYMIYKSKNQKMVDNMQAQLQALAAANNAAAAATDTGGNAATDTPPKYDTGGVALQNIYTK